MSIERSRPQMTAAGKSSERYVAVAAARDVWAATALHEGQIDSNALGHALHRAQFGVIVTAESSQPSFVNSYAYRVLEQADGLALVDSGLQAMRPSDTKVLRDVIGKAARREETASATLLLPRHHSTRPLVVHVPVPGYRGTDVKEATLFVCDPDTKPDVEPSVLSKMFGLTKAEALLATVLMSGVTLEHAAASLCVSMNTARTHLKRVLMKTDTQRQAELLRLLLVCSGQIALELALWTAGSLPVM